MSPPGPAVAIVLTPVGRGAVATVLVEGSQATELVDEIFQAANGRRLAQQPLRRIVFGRWGSGDGEELVVVRQTPETVEVHCHGGQAAVAAVLASLASHGCGSVDWRDWNRHSAPNAIEAEAIEALAAVRTQKAAAILFDQLHGALAAEIEQVAQLLEAGAIEPAGQRLKTLTDRAAVGLHLVEPFRVVLAGPPNAGKSSLINALLGYERAIVCETPGTTRDVVTASAALGGWPVELADTAGLRASGDQLEAEGIRRARQQLSLADGVVLVFDGTLPWTNEAAKLVTEHLEALLVHNKCDRRSAPDARPPGLATSALAGTGLDALAGGIAARLVPSPPPAGSAVPFTVRQKDGLQAAQALLAAGELAAAMNVLRATSRSRG